GQDAVAEHAGGEIRRRSLQRLDFQPLHPGLTVPGHFEIGIIEDQPAALIRHPQRKTAVGPTAHGKFHPRAIRRRGDQLQCPAIWKTPGGKAAHRIRFGHGGRFLVAKSNYTRKAAQYPRNSSISAMYMWKAN